MVKSRVSETEIAAAAVAFLESYGWDVYQEVRLYHGGPVADIVGKLGRLTWVVESKSSFNLTVIEQAWRWTARANMVSVITPCPRGDAHMRRTIMESLGIGHLVYSGKSVRSEVGPRLVRKASSALVSALRPEHKTTAPAGTNKGGYWTPFGATCRLLREHVASNPGCRLKDAIGSISHHYKSDSSANASILTWLEKGRLKGVSMRRDGKNVFLDPAPYVDEGSVLSPSAHRRRRR